MIILFVFENIKHTFDKSTILQGQIFYLWNRQKIYSQIDDFIQHKYEKT